MLNNPYRKQKILKKILGKYKADRQAKKEEFKEKYEALISAHDDELYVSGPKR
jgi:hypothetical protein